MALDREAPAAVRPVVVLAAGGTIAMRGEHATPALDARDLVAAVPDLLRFADLRVRSLLSAPGSQMRLEDALAVARAAREEATAGAGVVVTHGTDTLEETAYLCDVLSGAEAPIVLTGAIRPASAPGADGPANLLDAVCVASSEAATGAGAVVVFAGEVHAGRHARKTDSSGPAAFSSPQFGPLGHVSEGWVELAWRPRRRPPLDPPELSAHVPIVPLALGDDGALVRAALGAGADGLVVVTLGAGHAAPPALAELAAAAARIPVVATCRPERGAFMRSTYGFEGSERDLRAAGLIPAGALSPQAARMELIACLGADLPPDAITGRFADFFA